MMPSQHPPETLKAPKSASSRNSPAAPGNARQGRVAIAMSGGVDSSVAAALLTEQGYDVVGVHMKLHDAPDAARRDKSCCSLDDSLDARQVCGKLGIPFYVFDMQSRFKEKVIDYFVGAYQQGLTPNPCVMCNQAVKNATLLQMVREIGCDYLATGHYARIRQDANGEYQMAQATDLAKDQTYFLWGTPREELPYLLYPLAALEKPAARAHAGNLGLITWDKPDSQEVCFVPKDYRDFLEGKMAEPPLPGPFVDLNGREMGTHRGLPFYTIGQRRGLGLSAPRPLYVVALDQTNNRVVLGEEADLYASEMTVREVNWVSMAPAREALEAQVKIRHSHTGSPATVFPREDGTLKIRFHTPVRAITPGQAAAFYSGDVLLGGGWIEGPGDNQAREGESPALRKNPRETSGETKSPAP